jgi:hypothetical protein
MAAQKGTRGDSLVAFTVDAVMENYDDNLRQWINQCLVSTLGPWPPMAMEGIVAGAAAQPHDITQVSAMMAAEVGKGVGLGSCTLAPLQQDKSAQGWTSDSDDKGYTKDNIALLMGFCLLQVAVPLKRCGRYSIAPVVRALRHTVTTSSQE